MWIGEDKFIVFPMFFHFSFPLYNCDAWYRIDDIYYICKMPNAGYNVFFNSFYNDVDVEFLEWNQKNGFQVRMKQNGIRILLKNDEIDIKFSNLILHVTNVLLSI